eukprot:m.219916 g.219916  ORF g.219916 m.219916 type:complete len:452 (+) comp30738_c0_seq1:3-1358(+)
MRVILVPVAPMTVVAFLLALCTTTASRSAPHPESTSPSACATDEDCELLGTCTHGVCQCAPGFTGPTCGQLRLGPVDAETKGRVWPTVPQPHSPDSQLAWSFAPVYDPVTRKYNAVVEMACGSWGKQLSLWAVSSDNATTGYTLQRRLTSVGPNSPHLVLLANGTYVMHFFSMHVAAYNASAPVCDGNITKTLHAPPPDEPVIPVCHIGQDPHKDNCLAIEGGTYNPDCNVYAAFTNNWPDGPWTVHCVPITGAGWAPYNATLYSIGTSNPTVTLLQDGRALASFRSHAAYWPSIRPGPGDMGGEHTGFALGPSLIGPFHVSANLSWEYGNDEDPFVWQQPDGTMHCLYHNGRGSKHPNHGLHAFSHDGITWHKPQGALDPTCTQFPHACPAMYDNNITYTDGTTEVLTGRERPSLLFDPVTHVPIGLYNGWIPADSTQQWYAGAQSVLSS